MYIPLISGEWGRICTVGWRAYWANGQWALDSCLVYLGRGCRWGNVGGPGVLLPGLTAGSGSGDWNIYSS